MDKTLAGRIERFLEGLSVSTVQALTRPEPKRIVVLDDARYLVLERDQLEEFDQIVARLARSALHKGGPSPRAVDRYLIDACLTSIEEGASVGLRELQENLNDEMATWTVLESIKILASHGHPLPPTLQVGRSVVLRELPPQVEEGWPGQTFRMMEEDYPPPVLSVEVLAHDNESARLIAHDVMEESRALMKLVGHLFNPQNGAIVFREGVANTGAVHRVESFHVDGFVQPPTPWLQGLLNAFERDPAARTEWERRVVAASRWLLTGERSSWPTACLTAFVSALECLFLEGGEQEKGKAMASAIPPKLWFGDLEERKLERWLRDLYVRRSGAVHAGRLFAREVELERLRTLVRGSLSWAGGHLVPGHRHGDRQVPLPCATWDEVNAG